MGRTVGSFSIYARDDNIVENGEAFVIIASAPSTADNNNNCNTTVTIIDNDCTFIHSYNITLPYPRSKVSIRINNSCTDVEQESCLHEAKTTL